MARIATNVGNLDLLNAALEGLELQKKRIEAQIQQVRAMLGGRKLKQSGTALSPVIKAERNLSAAARKRIAMAQKKRWAEYRKTMAARKQQ